MSAPGVSNRAARRRAAHPRGPAQPSLASTVLGRMQLGRFARSVVAHVVGDEVGLDVASLRVVRRLIDDALGAEIERRGGGRRA